MAQKKNKYLVPGLFVIGTGLAYYFLVYKKSEGDESAPPPVLNENLSDTGTLDPEIIVTPPPTPTLPAPLPVADDPFTVAPEMKNYTKDDFYNYMNDPIRKAHGYNSLDIRKAHTLTGLQIMYALSKYIPFSNKKYWVAFDSMTDLQLLNTWVYVNLYLSRNKILQYSADPVLYNAISALQSKFGIF